MVWLLSIVSRKPSAAIQACKHCWVTVKLFILLIVIYFRATWGCLFGSAYIIPTWLRDQRDHRSDKYKMLQSLAQIEGNRMVQEVWSWGTLFIYEKIFRKTSWKSSSNSMGLLQCQVEVEILGDIAMLLTMDVPFLCPTNTDKKYLYTG